MESNRDLRERLHGWAGGIASWLAGSLADDGGFPARSFYGETFGIWLMKKYPGAASEKAADLLLESYRQKDKSGAEFHWEFNKYALVNLHLETGDERFGELAHPLRFKNTPATNWVLLRCTTQMRAGEPVGRILLEVKSLLRRRQCRAGLICDEPGARSFQYHCFSAALIGEMWSMSRDRDLAVRFRRAVDFIVRFSLTNGDTLYIGRGQEQSFGYGSLIYLLASAAEHTGSSEYLTQLEVVLGHLGRFCRKDGSFPLVASQGEKGFPRENAADNPMFPGWYSYNNFFDYLPFLGVMLSKAAAAVSRCPAGKAPNWRPAEYSDPMFRVVRRPDYDGVVAAPGGTWKGWGHWSNDLPVPYIISGSERLTPSYGGEQYGRTLYCQESIPLPVFRQGDYYLSIRRKRIWSFLLGNALILFSPYGVVVRRFRFDQSVVAVADLYLSHVPLYAWFLFDAPMQALSEDQYTTSTGLGVAFSRRMEIQPKRYHAWCGELAAVRSVTPCKSITMRLQIRAR